MKQLICPLLSIGRKGDALTPCIGDSCAFAIGHWNLRGTQETCMTYPCAIHVIADEVERRESELEAKRGGWDKANKDYYTGEDDCISFSKSPRGQKARELLLGTEKEGKP